MYPGHTLTLRHLLISHYAIIDIGDTGWPINPLDRKDTHGCDSWAVFSIPPQGSAIGLTITFVLGILEGCWLGLLQ